MKEIFPSGILAALWYSRRPLKGLHLTAVPSVSINMVQSCLGEQGMEGIIGKESTNGVF